MYLQISRLKGLVKLYRNMAHTVESHRINKKKFLSVMQMAGIDRSLSTHATASAKHIRQASNRLTDVDQHISPELKGLSNDMLGRYGRYCCPSN